MTSASVTGSGVFAGREAELSMLRAAYDEALSGHGRVCLVIGEPGIGKTRLAEEFTATVSDAVVTWGACWDGGGSPAFLPWRAALRDLGVAAALDPPHSQDPESARFAMFETVVSRIREIGDERPVVIVLDDLHDADTGSLLLLRFVAKNLDGARVLVLGTSRDTAGALGSAVGGPIGDVLRVGRTLSLGALGASAVRQVAEAAIEGLTDEDVQALAETSGGNPLFLREIIGAHGSRRGQHDVPVTVREAIRQRATALSQPTLDVLHAAAVLGREFDAEVVADVVDLDRVEVLEACAEAERERLIDETLSGWRFSHGVVREALYAMLGPARQLRFHAATARVLARRPDTDDSIIAHHFFRAAEPEGAIEHGRRAAERAVEQLAFEEAVVEYERVIQAVEMASEIDSTERCDLYVGLAAARWKAGDVVAARATYVRALEVALQIGDGTRYAQAALGRAGPPEAAEFEPSLADPLRQALALLPGDALALQARVRARLSDILINTGHPAERRRADDALAMARSLGDPETLAFVLRCRYYNVWEDDLVARLADTDVLVGSRLPELEVRGRCWRAAVHLTRGDVARFDTEIGLAARLAEGLRDPYLSWLVTVSRATRACLAGDFEESERLAGEAVENGPALRAVLDGFGVQTLFLRYLTTGWTELESLVRAGADAFPASPVRRAALGALLADADRPDEARAEFERLAADDFNDVPADFQYLLTFQILAFLCGSVGDERRAAILYERLLPYQDWCIVAGVSSGFLGSVQLGLGIVARVAGRLEDALRHLRASEAMHQAMGAHPWVALSRFEVACTLSGSGAVDEGASALAAIRRDAIELGMLSLSKRVERQTAAAPAAEPNTFRREGDVWRVSYDGRTIRLRDAKGVRDLAHLIDRRGEDVHVLDLVAAEGQPGSREAPRSLARDGGAPVLDARARRELAARVRDLEEDLEEADAWADQGRVERLRDERDFIVRELAAAHGFGGRARSLGDPAERARKAVKGRIDDALGRIEREHPELGRHLRRSIRTGLFCTYAPPEGTSWTI